MRVRHFLMTALALSMVPALMLQAEEPSDGEVQYGEFELMPNPVSIQSYAADEGRVDVYGTFTEFVNEYGTVRELNDQMLLMKHGEVVPVSTEFEFIHQRPDQVLVDTITGKDEKAQYLSVLTERRVLEDYYTKLEWPEELSNAGITEISSGLDSSEPVVMVRYADHSVAAFNYVTGNLLFLDESEKESLGFMDYLRNWATETFDKLFRDDNQGYEDTKALVADAGLIAEAEREQAVWKVGEAVPDGLQEAAAGERGLAAGESGLTENLQKTAQGKQIDHYGPQDDAEGTEALPAEETGPTVSEDSSMVLASPDEISGDMTDTGAALPDGETAVPGPETAAIVPAAVGTEPGMAGAIAMSTDAAAEGLMADSMAFTDGSAADAGAWEAAGENAETQTIVTADGQILPVTEYQKNYDEASEYQGNSDESSEYQETSGTPAEMDYRESYDEPQESETAEQETGILETQGDGLGDGDGSGNGSDSVTEEVISVAAGRYLTAYDPVSGKYEVYMLTDYLEKSGTQELESLGDQLNALTESGTYSRLSGNNPSGLYEKTGKYFVLAVFGCMLILLGVLICGEHVMRYRRMDDSGKGHE